MWHVDDYRRTHPEFPPRYAHAINAYSLQDPRLYAALGAALHSPERANGPGGVSESIRRWMPYVKLLDMAVEEAGVVWGCFIGRTNRGVKYAFPQPTVAAHGACATASASHASLLRRHERGRLS
jgi:hypothetical protein